MSLRFAPRDRRIEVCPIQGVAAPRPPSRLWVSWPWEPFLTVGGSVFLIAVTILTTVPLPWVDVALTATAAIIGLSSAFLGVAIARVRRHRQVRGFQHASMALLAQRYR